MVIATLQDPDEGAIDLDGLNVLTQKNAVRKILGYLPQEFGVYPKMSALDMLNHLAVLKGVVAAGERKAMVEALLQQTNLWDVRKKALATFSGGMKQRFGIAQALLANPRLIIVDEPTAGLDPAERNRFLNLLSSIGRDVTVILSTHIVDDVRELCPRMAIIASGKVLLEDVPGEALRTLDGQLWARMLGSDEELRTVESELHIVSAHLVGGQHEIRCVRAVEPRGRFQRGTGGVCLRSTTDTLPAGWAERTSWPVTYLMLQAVEGSATLFFFIVAALYAAELIWRERDNRFDGIHDALPLAEATDWFSKPTAIAFVEIFLLSVTMLTGHPDANHRRLHAL